jgi:hypothetical protein
MEIPQVTTYGHVLLAAKIHWKLRRAHIRLEKRISKEAIGKHTVSFAFNQLWVVDIHKSGILCKRGISMPKLKGKRVACEELVFTPLIGSKNASLTHYPHPKFTTTFGLLLSSSRNR